MRVIRTVGAFVLLSWGLAVAPQAPAQGNFYIGGSIGSSDIDSSIAVSNGLITSGSVDGKDVGIKLFGGFQLSPNLALELAYVDLGTVNYSGSFGAAPVFGGRLEITGLNVSAVGTFPVNPGFGIFGKVGVFAWETRANDVTNGIPFAQTRDGSDLSVGLGMEFSVTKNSSVRAEWEQFKIGSDNASLLSAGFVVRF